MRFSHISVYVGAFRLVLFSLHPVMSVRSLNFHRASLYRADRLLAVYVRFSAVALLLVHGDYVVPYVFFFS
jgi:hypothetical protein